MVGHDSRLAVFRADAGERIGAGHVMRCLALAEGLGAVGWRCGFAVAPGTLEVAPALARSGHEILLLDGEEREEPQALAWRWPGAALLVVDHYRRDATFERSCRPWAARILVIDDLADRPHCCDGLIDSALGRMASDYAPLVASGCRLFLGPDYAPLRPQFARARPRALARRRRAGPVRRILVGLGATDPDNMTAQVLDALARTAIEADIDIVLGSAAPHLKAVAELARALPKRASLRVDIEDMAGLMADADLAIGAAGSSAWERCCLGLPSALIVLGADQAHGARELDRRGAARLLGRPADLDRGALAATLHALARDQAGRAAMSEHAAALCDGEGRRRIVALFAPTEVPS
ncbi:MAG: UDP-2,4-diacetamido-2,4,6-trideoxy-beta-L-altropyranose hydrolase [Pseudomonadota bacterium]